VNHVLDGGPDTTREFGTFEGNDVGISPHAADQRSDWLRGGEAASCQITLGTCFNCHIHEGLNAHAHIHEGYNVTNYNVKLNCSLQDIAPTRSPFIPFIRIEFSV